MLIFKFFKNGNWGWRGREETQTVEKDDHLSSIFK